MGSPDLEKMHNYFLSGQDGEQIELSKVNYFIKLQEVAPNIVRKQVLQDGVHN